MTLKMADTCVAVQGDQIETIYVPPFKFLGFTWSFVKIEMATLLNFKGSQLDAFCHRPYCTVTLNSNFTILKKQKLFSIRVKELFDPLVSQEKAPIVCYF